jgi:phosphatidylserine/phosphatidylglycerophosphate/cardiolipin synthase-like enzyme
MIYIILIIFFLYAGVLVRHRFKPMPSGTDYESPVYYVNPDDVFFIHDLRFEDEQGNIVFEEMIFSEIFAAIESGRKSVLADMFLYNSDHGEDKHDPGHRSLTWDFTDLLCAKGEQGLDVLLITDELNNFYNSYDSPILERLQKQNVKTVITNLDRLRDSNPLYSGWYRLFFSWIPAGVMAIIKHPFGHPEKKITLPALLRSLNFKANHRKVVVVDSNLAIVTSANPHDPSSLHCNIAFGIKGAFAREVEYAEKAVAAFSGFKPPGFECSPPEPPEESRNKPFSGHKDKYRVQLLTENKIKDYLLREIRGTGRGELIMMASLYLTDRVVIRELKQTASRGVEIRIILDSSEHAFGLKKYGIPNKHSSLDLYAVPEFGRNLNIKWYKTHGEQFHAKLAAFKRKDSFVVIGGSANFTSKNLDNYNLELNLRFATNADSRLCREICAYFDRMWFNQNGSYTLDYELLKDENRLKYILYRIQEGTGMCTY